MPFRRARRSTLTFNSRGSRICCKTVAFIVLYNVAHCIYSCQEQNWPVIAADFASIGGAIPLYSYTWKSVEIGSNGVLTRGKPNVTMRKESSLPVRLDTEISRRLDRAAERLGITKSALIRVLVKSFVDQLEADGGKITFPLRWQDPKRDKSRAILKFVAKPRLPYNAKDGKRET
jgi:antitoxin component of RelBE/YafQ-DinJ toxin-antitoxin module